MKKILFSFLISLGIASLSYGDGEVTVINKIIPKNGAFIGIVDSSQTLVNTSNFTRNLSASDTDVQKALNTLDQLSAGSSFSVNDEEVLIINNPTMLNFKGSGVNVTLNGTTATITVAGSGSGGCEDTWDLDPLTDLMPSSNPIDGGVCGNNNPALGVFYNEVQITSPTVQINFKGSGVNVVQDGSTATVTISGGGSGGVADGSNAGDLTELDSNGDIMPSLVTFANDVNCDLDSNNQIMFKVNVSRAPTFFVGGIGFGGVWELSQNELDFITIQ